MAFIKFYLFFLLLALFIWGILIIGQLHKPTKSSQWVWDVNNKKEQYATHIKKPKIVLVSGSNALFGVKSPQLSEALHFPVINDAVNAGIGLPTLLMHAKRVIQKHDIVLLPLEYPLYSYDGKPGVQMIDYLYARTPYMIKALTLQEQFWLFWHTRFKRLVAGYTDGKEVQVTRGLYGSHHVDTFGDQTETQKAKQTQGMKDEIAQHQKHPETYGKDFDPDALGWAYLSNFVEWCEKRDVPVIFMPSTLMKDDTYVSDKKEKWFYAHIAQEVKKRGWHFVGDPYAYMYAAEAYLNTNFHLVDEAREKRTLQMIKDLRLSEFADIFQRK